MQSSERTCLRLERPPLYHAYGTRFDLYPSVCMPSATMIAVAAVGAVVAVCVTVAYDEIDVVAVMLSHFNSLPSIDGVSVLQPLGVVEGRRRRDLEDIGVVRYPLLFARRSDSWARRRWTGTPRPHFCRCLCTVNEIRIKFAQRIVGVSGRRHEKDSCPNGDGTPSACEARATIPASFRASIFLCGCAWIPSTGLHLGNLDKMRRK